MLNRLFKLLIALALLPVFGTAYAQEADSPSFGVFVGVGAQRDTSTHPALQAGGSADQPYPNHWIGWMFEGGYLGPVTNPHSGSGLFSVNYIASWNAKRASKLFPFVTGGYTYLFGTGNAANFGPGMDLRLSPRFGLRLEGRDYLSFAPHQHNFAIRVGLRRYVWD
jgi:Na+/proline symporter